MGALRQRSPLRSRPRSLTKAQVELAVRFRAVVLSEPVCVACGYSGVFLDAHHVIPKEKLRRLLSAKGALCPDSVLWDPRNGVPACNENAPLRCHPRHTNAFKRIPRSALPAAAFEFAEEHGLISVIEADYPDVEVAA